MNSVPPSHPPPDDVDDRYRRASARDPSRPSETVRRAVLAHAAQLAAQRAPGRTAANSRWWRPAMFGTLAAAGLAALVIAPQWRAPHSPQAGGPSAQTPARTSVPVAVAPPPPPAVEAPPALAKPRPSRHRFDNPSAADRARPQEQGTNAPAAPRVAENAAQSARSRAAAGSSEGGALTEATTAKTSVPAAASRAAGEPPDADRPADLAAAFRRAAEAGDLAGLEELLGKQTDIDSRDSSGRTALMLATVRGRVAAVGALLAYGADPNVADARGTTPLQAAVAGKQPAIVKALQRYGAR